MHQMIYLDGEVSEILTELFYISKKKKKISIKC